MAPSKFLLILRRRRPLSCFAASQAVRPPQCSGLCLAPRASEPSGFLGGYGNRRLPGANAKAAPCFPSQPWQPLAAAMQHARAAREVARTDKAVPALCRRFTSGISPDSGNHPLFFPKNISYICIAFSQTRGVTAAPQILVLLVQVRILAGLQGLLMRQPLSAAFFIFAL